MKQEENTKESSLNQIIAWGLGTTVGIAVGDFTGISSGGVQVISQWGLDRFITPIISKRESIRLFQWGKQAAEGIVQRLANGEKYRNDGFFDKTPTIRSKIDEVVESTLKKVMDITEEPKIKFIANLTENVHFDSDLDMDTYRRILKILDELSYRQLCIIKLCMNVDRIDLCSIGNPDITPNLSSILTDCLEVCDKGLIKSNNPLMEKINELYLGFPPAPGFNQKDIDPEYQGFGNQGVSNFVGENMFKFAKLDQIPDEDVDSILMELKSDL